jgi:Raf kinase inhibitor-like YbhB/YbcL family protein
MQKSRKVEKMVKHRALFWLFVVSLCVAELHAKMQIYSPAFPEGGRIARKYGCMGKNLSIPLRFRDIPKGTKSLALVMEDPDAPSGTFIHWVLYGIAANLVGLEEGLSRAKLEDRGIKEGVNDFGNIAYGGPCPPRGEHRYFIKLYALDISPHIGEGASAHRLEEEMKGHIIEEASTMGRYSRSGR